ncbi:MAG: cyclic-di-AMP receptor [Dehalococcoidia bacterium]
MTEQPTPEKLLIIVVSPNDGERLMQRLVRDGVPATRIGSAGGFLSRGSSTILSGVPALQVEPVLDLIRQICPVRTELAPVQTLPLVGTAATGPPIEVRTGGAIVFVLDIERFERI